MVLYSIHIHQLLWSDGSWGKNVVIFGINNSSSMYVDNNNKKNTLVLGEGQTE